MTKIDFFGTQDMDNLFPDILDQYEKAEAQFKKGRPIWRGIAHVWNEPEVH